MISNPFPCSICLKANRRCILYSARASLGVRHGLQQLVLLPAVCLGCAVQMQSPYDYRELETLYRYEDGKYQIERGSDILRAWTMAESKSCVCPALEDTAHQDRGVDYTVEELQHQEQDSNQIDNDLTNPDLTETSHPVDETDAQVTRADTDEIDTADDDPDFVLFIKEVAACPFPPFDRSRNVRPLCPDEIEDDFTILCGHWRPDKNHGHNGRLQTAIARFLPYGVQSVEPWVTSFYPAEHGYSSGPSQHKTRSIFAERLNGGVMSTRTTSSR